MQVYCGAAGIKTFHVSVILLFFMSFIKVFSFSIKKNTKKIKITKNQSRLNQSKLNAFIFSSSKTSCIYAQKVTSTMITELYNMVFNACPQTAPDGRGFRFNLFSFHLEFSLVICY